MFRQDAEKKKTSGDCPNKSPQTFFGKASPDLPKGDCPKWFSRISFRNYYTAPSYFAKATVLVSLIILTLI